MRAKSVFKSKVNAVTDADSKVFWCAIEYQHRDPLWLSFEAPWFALLSLHHWNVCRAAHSSSCTHQIDIRYNLIFIHSESDVHSIAHRSPSPSSFSTSTPSAFS